MATYNLNTTASIDLLSSDISASQETTFSIANPLSNSSYFTFETVRNSDGFYDSSSPKNMAGTYSLGAGLSGVVKSDYIASVIVKPGGGDLTFTPDNYISGSSLNLRGTSSPPAPTGTSFDADAQAFFTRVADAGGSLSTTEQEAVNQLVIDMKDDGIWTKMKAIYPMVGASAAACAQNLKSSSFTGSFSTGWTFASTGVKGNGTSAYMNTGLLSNDFTDNKGGYTCYTRDNNSPTGVKVQYGSFGNTWVISWMNIKGYGINGNGNYGTFSSIPNNYKGSVVNQRVDDSNIKINFSGGNETVANTIHTTLDNTRTIYVGAWGNNSTGLYHTDNEIAFFAKHDFLDETESVDFIDSIQAFQTTLSRNV